MLVYLIEFFVAFLLIFLYYRVFIIKKSGKIDKKKLPPELSLFIKMNKINMKKITYKKLLQVLSVFNALAVSLTLLTTEVTDKIILKLLIAIPVGTLFLYLFYKLLGFYYKKKGMVLDV